VPKLNAKAALVSGPPGIGKTSSTRIICKALGFEVLEMNASDVRNKSAIESTVGLLAGNKSLDYWTVAG
jgi:replication factor C subunit 1